MPAYCGCATPASKVRWGIVASGLALGVALIIRMIVEISSCRICYPNGSCEKEYKPFQYHWESVNGQSREWVEDGDGNVIPGAHMSCSLGLAGICWWLGILSFIAASIPCYINCCCATNPYQSMACHGHQMVPTGAHAASPVGGATPSLEVPVPFGKAYAKRGSNTPAVQA